MTAVTRNVVAIDMTPPNQPDDLEARRAAARRTAWITAGVALVILVGFILNIVLR